MLRNKIKKIDQLFGIGTIFRNGRNYSDIREFSKFDSDTKTVTIFGYTGPVGNMLVDSFAKSGYYMMLPYRCARYRARQVMTCHEYGKAVYINYETLSTDDDRLITAVNNSDVVVSLVGTESVGRQAFKDNIEAPTKIAKLVANSPRTKSFIHVSSFYQEDNSSNIIRLTKHEGEKAVRAVCPDVNIVRPTTLYHYMSFLPQYVYFGPHRFSALRAFSNSVIKRPLFAGDFCKAIVNIGGNPELFKGKTFELFYHTEYYLRDILDYSAAFCNVKRNSPLDSFFSLVPPYVFKNFANFFLYKSLPVTLTVDDFLRREQDVLYISDTGVVPIGVEEGIQMCCAFNRTGFGTLKHYLTSDTSNLKLTPAYMKI